MPPASTTSHNITNAAPNSRAPPSLVAAISIISATPSASTTMSTTAPIPAFDQNVTDDSSTNILTTTSTPSSRNVNSS
ncbi:hypothetical protein SprV_0401598000 [Sparganum proliferum]